MAAETRARRRYSARGKRSRRPRTRRERIYLRTWSVIRKALRDAGVVEELEVEAGNRVRGFPYKFYRLTEEARELFDENGLFPEGAWRRQYERVQKTGEIRDVQEMPRPEP